MIQQFLTHVLPDLSPAGDFGPTETYYTLALGAEQYRRQYACSTTEVVKQSCDIYSQYGHNAYMALASYRIEGGRKKANAVAAKAIWADIDAGKDGTKYANANMALTDLSRFVTETGLSPTYIIASGMGLHVYWCFENNVPANEWLSLAKAFKTTCDNHGLAVDPERARDISSVLRCPGTIHQKSGLPVRILAASTGTLYTPESFSGLLDTEPETIAPEKPNQSVSGPDMTELMGMGPQAPQVMSEPIVKGCPQILTMGLGLYPQWFAAMSVLKRCVDGREWAHKLSQFSPDKYDASDTDRRFDEAFADAPCLCSTFEKHNPDLCTKCIYRGRVKTPVQIAKLDTTQRPKNLGPAFIPQEKGDGPLALRFPEKFEYERVALSTNKFRIDSRGMVLMVSKRTKDGGWIEEEHVICTTQLFYKYGVVTREPDNENRPTRSHVFEALYPNGKTEELTFIVEKDLNSYGIMRWFANANMYPTSSAYTEKHFMQFMNAYLESVVHNAAELKSYDQFGWTAVTTDGTQETKPGFVTGSGVITEDGLTHAAFSPMTQKLANQAFYHSGTLENWKFVPQMYKILGQYLGQLVICMSFAAPLMKYGSGEAKNCILSLYSLKSSKGKTTALRFAASIWGNPYEGQFFTQQESTAAKCRRLGVLNNLPAFLDEITNTPDEEMADLAYVLISGLEKHKLKASGAEFVKTGDWSTCVFSTSNKSYKAALTKQYGMTDARLLRVMEYECSFAEDPRCQTHEVLSYIDKCKALCKENYGIAGPQFLYNLLQKPERLETLTLKMERWVRDHGFGTEERFMAFPLALALQAGRWAVEFGLLDYDMDALETWVLNAFVSANRRATDSFKLDALAVITDYLNSRIQSTLVVHSDNRPASMPDPGNPTLPDKYVIYRPTREVTVRFVKEGPHIIFSQYDFNSWCRAEHLQPKAIMELLKAKGISLVSARVNLNKNVSWLNLPRLYCYKMEGVSIRKLGYVPPEGNGIMEVANE